MKRSTSLTVFLLSLVLTSFSQINPKKKEDKDPSIYYQQFDYLNDGPIVYKGKATINYRVGIKIINVNKRLVTFNNDIQSVSYNEEKPALFETVFKTATPSAGNGGNAITEAGLNLVDLSLIDSAGIPDSVKKKLTDMHNMYEDAGNELKLRKGLINAYGEDYSHIKVFLQYQSDLMQLKDVCNTKFSDLLDQVLAVTKNTFTDDVKVTLETSDRAYLLSEKDYLGYKGVLNRTLNKVISDADKHYKQLSTEFLPSKTDQLSTNITKIKNMIISVRQQLNRFDSDTNAKKIIEKLTEELNNYRLEKDFNDSKQIYTDADFPAIKTNIDAFNATGKTDFFATYDYFNESNFTYYVNPQPVDKDLLTISVTVTPKDNVPCSPAPRSYVMMIRAKHGLKVDFSTGLFGNLGGDNFLDQSYRYDSVPGQSDKYVIVKNEGKNKFALSVGALMHVYYRNGNDFHLAGCFGVSTENLDKINYHLGGSAIFVFSLLFILRGGITIKKTTLISDKYEVGQIVDKQSAPTDIPLSTFNRFGFFFAFTYNLTAK